MNTTKANLKRAERLKTARKELGLRQTEVASKLGISQTAYCLWETGRTPLRERHINSVCSILNLNKDWVMTGKGEMFTNEHPQAEILASQIARLNEKNQKYIYAIVNTMLDEQGKPPKE